MCADGGGCYAEPLKIKWHFAETLDCIGVHWNVPSERNNFLDRLDRSDFVIGMHDTNKCNMFALCFDDAS